MSESIAAEVGEGGLASLDAVATRAESASRGGRFVGRGLDRGLMLAAVIGAPTSLVLATQAELRTSGLLGLTATATAIWFLALQAVLSSVSARGLDPPLAAPIGAALGFGALSFVNFVLLDVPMPLRVILLMTGIVLVMAGMFLAWRPRAIAAPRRVILVGMDERARELIHELGNRDSGSFECVGVVGPQRADLATSLPFLGSMRDLLGVVERERPDVIVCATARLRTRTVDCLLDAGITSVRVIDPVEFQEQACHRVATGRLHHGWFVGLLDIHRGKYSAAAKRAFDIVVSSVVLVLSIPLLVAIALAIRCYDRGPVLFRQIRSGEGGRPFTILKFRSMIPDAERHTAVWAAENDPRVTPIGRFMRRTRLDELPQLWNVLRGEMSIVGPRPERPEYLDALEADIRFWSRRHLLRPGLTGWAQLHLGYTADISGAERKLSYDLYYLKHRSLQLDFLIVVATVVLLFSGRGAR